MSGMSTPRTAPAPKLAYRPAELARVLGVALPTIYGWIDRGVIPIKNREERRAIVIPAWRLDAYLATGDWDHEAWRPVPPGAHNLPADRPEERSATQAER